jgi:hypothetical protein
MRRLISPQRRPGLLAVLVRWRVEVLLAVAWYCLGIIEVGIAIGIAATALALSAISFPAVGHGAVSVVQSLVVPHRVRSALIQAGIASRRGRPPWIVIAWPQGDAVLVRLWLRAGTTTDDLRRADHIIAGATGATRVEISDRSARLDRATLIVRHPRWGWPGR